MTSNPLHKSGGPSSSSLFLIAVVRFSDKAVIASFRRDNEFTVEGVRECIAGTANIQQGKRYTSQGESQSIHYILDVQGRVYSIVTDQKYPPRVAFMGLDELVQTFSRELGPRVITASENSLTRAAQQIFREIYEKYYYFKV
jgi:hypothetical protein